MLWGKISCVVSHDNMCIYTVNFPVYAVIPLLAMHYTHSQWAADDLKRTMHSAILWYMVYGLLFYCPCMHAY